MSYRPKHLGHVNLYVRNAERSRQWYEDVDRLHAILQSHGPEVLRQAMEAGLQEQVFGALYVERSLAPRLNFPEAVQ